MKEPGLLNCIAVNEKGESNDTGSVLVTDVPQGFFVSEIPKEIVVGDNITLNCGVTSYQYEPVLRWYYQKDSSKNPEIVTNKDIITNEKRYYAYWTTLNLNKVNKSQSGIYKCVAENFLNYSQKEEKIVRLEVLGE